MIRHKMGLLINVEIINDYWEPEYKITKLLRDYPDDLYSVHVNLFDIIHEPSFGAVLFNTLQDKNGVAIRYIERGSTCDLSVFGCAFIESNTYKSVFKHFKPLCCCRVLHLNKPHYPVHVSPQKESWRRRRLVRQFSVQSLY